MVLRYIFMCKNSASAVIRGYLGQTAATKGSNAPGFNVRLWWTNLPRLGRWPRNQMFYPHRTAQAQSGMAVITIPASPHWALLHSVEHIANVITLCYTLLWSPGLMSSVCVIWEPTVTVKRLWLVYKGTCLLYHALEPLAPALAEPSWFPGSFLNVKLNCMTWPKLTLLRILRR